MISTIPVQCCYHLRNCVQNIYWSEHATREQIYGKLPPVSQNWQSTASNLLVIVNERRLRSFNPFFYGNKVALFIQGKWHSLECSNLLLGNVKLGQLLSFLGEYVDAGIIYVHYRHPVVITSSDIGCILQYSFSKTTNKTSAMLVQMNHIFAPSYPQCHHSIHADCQSPPQPPPLTENLCCRSAVLLCTCTSHPDFSASGLFSSTSR